MKGFEGLRAAGRKAIRLSQEQVVRSGHMGGGCGFPLVMEPGVEGVNLSAWASASRGYIEGELLRAGAILFRGFGIDSVQKFDQLTRTVTPDLLDYHERAAPRKEVSRQIYTSTEYPADQYIPLHHEMSYSHNWPEKIWFFCLQPARLGGNTPIADDRKVFQLIPRKIKEKFIEKKVMYVRNYGQGVDLSWQEAFQTNDRAAVEAYCRRAGLEIEWRAGNRMRTRNRRDAVATHPKTNETVWFNHAHMFHVSNLEGSVREALLAEFKEDELPRNAFYGDGTPIDGGVLEEIREIYRQAAVSAPWQIGDVLLLDNFLASHGREPYDGPRKILVAMAQLYTGPLS
ncbi:MAG TPA: TauD/TfdA family dioxygenase [Blastocatellia bacterium]|nr:TauD/TfdA family dioxygenase [Blastocatellia bacterium]